MLGSNITGSTNLKSSICMYFGKIMFLNVVTAFAVLRKFIGRCPIEFHRKNTPACNSSPLGNAQIEDNSELYSELKQSLLRVHCYIH